ncbi:MAG: hypothetical protein AB1Z66_11740 [Candidatus Limnocylindrales bacterium]
MSAGTRTLVAALAAVLLLPVPALGADDGTLDDEAIATLLQVHRDTGAALIDVQQDLDEIPGRIESDDWLVFPTRSGDVIEVDLNDVRDLLPAVQVALALSPEAKQAVLDGLQEADFRLWVAASVVDAMEGGIEGQSPAEIIPAIKSHFGQTPEYKRRTYADHVAALEEERDALDQLFVETFEWLDEQGVEVVAVPEPTPSPEPTSSPAPTPGAESEGIEYDAFEGLIGCWGNELGCYGPTLETGTAPAPESSNPDVGEDALTGCWYTTLGLGTLWVRVEEYGDDLVGGTVTSWQWGTEAEREYAIGWIEGDTGSYRPRGYFYGTGPWDAVHTCQDSRGGTSHWGEFDGWLHEEGAFWQLCGKDHARELGDLVDPSGNDVSWAYSGKFYMDRLPEATCQEKFEAARAYLDGRD